MPVFFSFSFSLSSGVHLSKSKSHSRYTFGACVFIFVCFTFSCRLCNQNDFVSAQENKNKYKKPLFFSSLILDKDFVAMPVVPRLPFYFFQTTRHPLRLPDVSRFLLKILRSATFAAETQCRPLLQHTDGRRWNIKRRCPSTTNPR